MEIIRLNDSYRGRELVFRYRTEHYYEISTREGENTFFLAVGAGHMLDPGGIISGLRDMGYTVELVS